MEFLAHTGRPAPICQGEAFHARWAGSSWCSSRDEALSISDKPFVVVCLREEPRPQRSRRWRSGMPRTFKRHSRAEQRKRSAAALVKMLLRERSTLAEEHLRE
jgi:hypothetical protein